MPKKSIYVPLKLEIELMEVKDAYHKAFGMTPTISACCREAILLEIKRLWEVIRNG